MNKLITVNHFIYDGTEKEVAIGIEYVDHIKIGKNIWFRQSRYEYNDGRVEEGEVRYYKKTKEGRSPVFKTKEQAENYSFDD